MPFQISLNLLMITPLVALVPPRWGRKKWDPGRLEFLDANRTHINIKLKMGIQKHTGSVYCSMTNSTVILRQ